MAAKPGSQPSLTVLLAVVCGCSGAASLGLELIWTRQLGHVFGSSASATATVLVAYMLGLGLGSHAGGRLHEWMSTRGWASLRGYAAIELAAGVSAMATTLSLSLLGDELAIALHQVDPSSRFWLRALASLLLLLPPTLAMGASMPVAIAIASPARADPSRDTGATTALLYGANTLGAMVGVLATASVILPNLGIRHSGISAAGVDLAIGLGIAAWGWVQRAYRPREPAPSAPPSPPSPTLSRGGRARGARLRRVNADDVAVTLLGAVGLGFEVLWIRESASLIGSSLQAFAATLAAYLFGIALGSLGIRHWLRRGARPRPLLIGASLALAVLGPLTTSALPEWVEVWKHVLMADVERVESFAIIQKLSLASSLVPVTIVMGTTVPLATALVAERGQPSAPAAGRVYLLNTLGGAGGALIVGQWGLPQLGLEGCAAVACAAALAATVCLLEPNCPKPYRRALIGACVLAGLVPWPVDRRALGAGMFKDPIGSLDFGVTMEPVAGLRPERLLTSIDGRHATVSVHDHDGQRALRTNGKTDASSHADVETQVLLAQLPMVFGEPARTAAVIGYASGMTVASLATHPGLERIDAIELEPAMVDASRHFHRWTHDPLRDPRVQLRIEDGRSVLAASPGAYDVIISEPSNPWIASAAPLFTREFFELAHRALSERGRLMQWIQLYEIDRDALSGILAAMRAHFPHVHAFATGPGAQDLLVLASRQAMGRDRMLRWSDLEPTTRDHLRACACHGDADLWSLLQLSPQDIDRLTADAPWINTDDNGRVELGTSTGHGGDLRANWRWLTTSRRGVLDWHELGVLDAAELQRVAFCVAGSRADPGQARRLADPSSALGRATRVFWTRLPAKMAQARLDAAIDEHPDFSPLRRMRALQLNATGQAAAAWDDIRAGLDRDPESLPLQILAAKSLAARGHGEDAWQLLASSLERDLAHRDLDLRRHAIALALNAGRTEDAHARLRSELELDQPQWFEGWQLLAQIERERGRDEAARAAEEAGEAARRNAAATLLREATRRRWLGEPKSSLRPLLDRALTVNPDCEPCRHWLRELDDATTTSDER